MRVLFCTDGSKISYNALLNYMQYYAKKDTEIDYICAVDWGFLPDNVIIEETGFVSSCKNIADEILAYTEKIITDSGFKAGNSIKLCGSAAEGISDQIETGEYQLVILGSNGKKGLQRWLGSVSKDVLDNSQIPVYISKNKKNRKRILFAVDTNTNNLEYARKFCEIIDLTDSELTLLSVIENPDLLFTDGHIDTNWLLSIKTKQEAIAQKTLNNIKEYFENQNIPVLKNKIIFGIPEQEILNEGKNNDLIVMQSLHKSRSERLFKNSVSKRVSENTDCDTLIIKA